MLGEIEIPASVTEIRSTFTGCAKTLVIRVEPGSYAAYRESLLQSGRVLNQQKPVTVLNTRQRREFFLSRVVTPASVAD